MKKIDLLGIYSGHRWLESVTVTIDSEGNIADITARSDSDNKHGNEPIAGYAIPSFKNSHSHSFQFAMAGLSEYQKSSTSKENFWTWRENMYKLALSLSPQDLQIIARSLFLDLMIHGYTHVVEFHYLQNDLQGDHYTDPLTLYHPIIEAAQEAGIQLTMTPVFYKNSDFERPGTPEQRRFLFKSVDSYFEIVEKLNQEATHQGFTVGLGIHSLRASSIEDLKSIVQNKPQGTPFHIHISEQIKEVQSCYRQHQKNPIELLFDSVDVDSSFNLVHATHASPCEIELIIKSKANVVLCPTTEANLGDGLFSLEAFHGLGTWSIGSDSHICRDPLEELRWLDYGQRLKHQLRNPLCQNQKTNGHDFSGDQLLRYASDAQASLGHSSNGTLEVGKAFNATVYSADSTTFSSIPSEQRLSHLIFSGNNQTPLGVFSNGQWLHRDALKHKKLQADHELHLCLERLFKH